MEGFTEDRQEEKKDDEMEKPLDSRYKVFDILFDPEYWKVWQGPSDAHFDMLKTVFIDSKDSAETACRFLKEKVQDKSIPSITKINFGTALRIALGQLKSSSENFNSAVYKEIYKTIEDNLRDLEKNSETPYFIATIYSPDIVLSPVKSFSKTEQDLTPIQITDDIYIQDNNYDPIPIFYKVHDKKNFDILIEKQKQRFESARPENRPALPENPSMAELKEFKKKFLDVGTDREEQDFKVKREQVSEKIQPKELLEYFPSSKNQYDLTQDEMLYSFRAFVKPEIRKKIEQDFDFDLNKISLREQLYFLTTVENRTNNSIGVVKDFVKIYKEGGIKTFLSVEHGGKEMGSTIIALAEKLQEQEAQKIFTEYAQLVDASSRMESVFQSVFQEEKEQSIKTIPFQIQDALMLRAKDILVGALKVAEQEGGDKLSVPDVLAAIEGIRTVVDIFSDIHNKHKFRFEKQNLSEKNLFKYNVQDKNGYEYILKVFVRPIAEKNAQARVNIELSFDTSKPNTLLQKAFQNEVISHTQNKKINSSVLRIGLDRESYGGTESVSLDIGRSERSDEEITRSGDVLGNLLALASTEGHHTTSPFDKNLAKEDVFALLATKLSNYLQSQDSS